MRFASHLSEVVNERDDSPGAIVLRHGLMASRIACVLTALRKGECAWAMPEYACSDEDFHTAMLMTDVLLEHSLLLSTCMQKSESKPKPLKPYFRLRPVLQVISGTFTFTQVVDKAVEMVKIITTDFQEGQIFKGVVVSIKEFGAFIEFAPGKEGMVHISKIAKERINHVEDVLTLGDVVTVVCLGKDKMGRISFSMKDVAQV
mgnify:CR=1 FL=1